MRLQAAERPAFCGSLQAVQGRTGVFPIVPRSKKQSGKARDPLLLFAPRGPVKDVLGIFDNMSVSLANGLRSIP